MCKRGDIASPGSPGPMINAFVPEEVPMVAVDSSEVASFKAGFAGVAFTPGDDGYDEARALWNGWFDKRPAVIATHALQPCLKPIETLLDVRLSADNPF